MNTHTPTPWSAIQRGQRWLVVAEGELGGTVAARARVLWTVASGVPQHGNTPEGNAQLIVRAVNAHDDLLTALKLALSKLQHSPECNAPIDYTPEWRCTCAMGEVFEVARKAIEKAEGRV